VPLVDSGDHTPTEQDQTRRRLTVAQAAEVLGITAEAVRTRIKRRKLDAVKEGGMVYVLLQADQTGPNLDPAVQGQDRTGVGEELLEELRERVAFLEGQLRRRDEEMARRDAVLLNMTEAMKALGPPSREDASESPESRGPPTPPAAGGKTQAPAERPPDTAEWPVRGGFLRPWWRRVVGR
jgi:hypothetical protein